MLGVVAVAEEMNMRQTVKMVRMMRAMLSFFISTTSTIFCVGGGAVARARFFCFFPAKQV